MRHIIDHRPVLDLEFMDVPDLINHTYRVINENTEYAGEFRQAVIALNEQLDEAHGHPQDEKAVCIAFVRIYGGV